MTNNTDSTNMVGDLKIIVRGDEKVVVPPDMSMNSSVLQSPKEINDGISILNQKKQSHYTSFKVMKSTAVDMN